MPELDSVLPERISLLSFFPSVKCRGDIPTEIFHIEVCHTLLRQFECAFRRLQPAPARPGYDWLNAEATRLPWNMEAPGLAADHVVRFSVDLRTLALKGITVEEVKISRCAPLHADEDTWKSTCKEWIGIALDNMEAYTSPEDRFEAFCRMLSTGSYRDRGGVSLTTCGDAYRTWISSDEPQDDFGFRVKRFCGHRSLVFSTRSHAGIAPVDTKEGDLICFFQGNLDPFILRREDKLYAFVGETYITGLMDGEWVQEAEGKRVKEFWIQ